ncbi:MAG TPA: squalene/phytoene synthase family protein [Candidatus Deferrimicrobium sp.]|nr:squalene/phytoene synthase family protein [Candidatus Deferrimicrobium sp.]
MWEPDQTRLDFAPHVEFGEILTTPILDIAARFWDNERYEAFKVCYRSMRIIDDAVDDRKAAGAIPVPQRREVRRLIEQWTASLKRQQPRDSFQKDLIAVMSKFGIPVWPWERLAQAMIYDLDHDGFATFKTFRQYCGGAAIAPASVFMHLCGVVERDHGYDPPRFDIRAAAASLAMFSYLVHLIRDFAKDYKNNLVYFSRDLLDEHRVSIAEIDAAVSGTISPSFRGLLKHYLSLAESYRRRARYKIDQLSPRLGERYRLSLEIVYSLYLQTMERFEPIPDHFSPDAWSPGPEEIQQRIDQTVAVCEFGSRRIQGKNGVRRRY